MKELSIRMPETIEEWAKVSDLIKRDTPMKGLPSSGSEYNRCPMCEHLVSKQESFCAKCGQRVEFVKKADPTVIPFEEM